ncbi:MAG TPA: UdgX family uracil-DNA binding protein [Rhizomicrobium sp.]
MYALRLARDAIDADFREAAKRALARDLAPRDVAFISHDSGIFFDDVPDIAAPYPMTVPRDFVELMHDAICHRAEDRFALLYDVLWRLKHGEPDLLNRASDPVIARLSLYVKAVRRDIHKMHAFVRFHKKETEDGELYIAWFEPEHFILKRATPFFADRFANMRWIIATPLGTATRNLKSLIFGPPRPKPTDLEDGILDGLWRTYYRTVFNPARLKTDAMTKEMPRRYWKNLPESDLIPELIEGAQHRVAAMDREADQAPRFADKARRRAKSDDMPKDTLSQIRKEAESCTDCPLYKHATQTVFGEGPARARIVLVGEQPGDQEDLAGKPFVGPAGQVLDRALDEAGIERAKVYITNAVKHFKFEPRGKRRIHSKPNAAEIKICHQWVARELATIEPEFVIALGATAAQSLMGRGIPIGKNRGKELTWVDGRRGIITVHPSYLLRIPDAASKAREYKAFVRDLKLAASLAVK